MNLFVFMQDMSSLNEETELFWILFCEKNVFFMRKVSFFKQKFGFPPKNRNVGNINNEIVHTNEKKLTSTSSLMLSRLEDLEFATLSLVRALWRAQLYK